jgi:hypothetical protein
VDERGIPPPHGYVWHSADDVACWLISEGLALVLLLDQMTRNVYRGQGQAFALDSIAREATAKVFAHPLYDELRPLEVRLSDGLDASQPRRNCFSSSRLSTTRTYNLMCCSKSVSRPSWRSAAREARTQLRSYA